MENLDELKQLVEGNHELARVQNLIDLYGVCVKDSQAVERTKFTEKVEEALIKALKL